MAAGQLTLPTAEPQPGETPIEQRRRVDRERAAAKRAKFTPAERAAVAAKEQARRDAMTPAEKAEARLRAKEHRDATRDARITARREQRRILKATLSPEEWTALRQKEDDANRRNRERLGVEEVRKRGRENNKKQRSKNPERARQYDRERRARTAGLPTPVIPPKTAEEWRKYHREWQRRKTERLTPEEKEQNRIRGKELRDARGDALRQQKREFYQRHKERINARRREEAKLDDPIRKLRKILRSRIRSALRRFVRGSLKKGSHVDVATFEWLGCSIEELKVHIESQFENGMTWDNWCFRGWHLDHVLGLATFDLTDPGQMKKACHFSNLQPLWGRENLSKGARSAPVTRFGAPIEYAT